MWILTIQLVSNFTNSNMSPYSSILMIKIWIWVSPSPVVSGPSIKFDQIWLILTKLWPHLSLNPTFNCDHNLPKWTFHYTFQIPRLDFKSKNGTWWTCVVYLYGYIYSLNLTIQSASNFTNINMSPYSSILMIKIWIWISLSPMILGPSIKFDRVWPTITKHYRIFL